MIHFDPVRHEYFVDGVRWPSVTELIEYSGLVSPFSKQPWYAQRGKYVHKAIELDIRGTLDPATVDPEVKPYLDAWREFQRDTRCSVVLNNFQVVNSRERYCGTLDVVLMMADGPFVTDAKAGGPSPWHELQVWLYKEALCDMRVKELAYPQMARTANLYLRPSKVPPYSWKPRGDVDQARCRELCDKWWRGHEVKGWPDLWE